MEGTDKSPEIVGGKWRIITSGKSIIIGSTEGNVSVPEKEDINIGVNVYRKA